MRHQIGNAPEKIIANHEMKVKSVCSTCNSGWMSDLEGKVKPTVGCMVQDVSLTLDIEQQHDIAAWAAKIAAVVDSTVASIRGLYYSKDDRHQLRSASSIPSRTTVLLGRFSGSSLLATGTTLRGDLNGENGVTTNCVTTVVVGHLAIQVFTIHPVPKYRDHPFSFTPKPGPWNSLLTQVWPTISSVNWPPPLTFTNGGPLSIARLQDRWRMGKRASV